MFFVFKNKLRLQNRAKCNTIKIFNSRPKWLCKKADQMCSHTPETKTSLGGGTLLFSCVWFLHLIKSNGAFRLRLDTIFVLY